MNRNDIYKKTPAGEDAMFHRAKVDARQQRMILVLIDGKTSVGEMSEKVGDSALTESAIAELSAGGFIVLEKAGDDAPPSEAPLHKPAELSQFSTFGTKDSLRDAITVSPQQPPVEPPAAQPAPPQAEPAAPVAQAALPPKAEPISPQPPQQAQQPVQGAAPPARPPETPSAPSAASAELPATPEPPPLPPELVAGIPIGGRSFDRGGDPVPSADVGGQVTATGEFTLPSFYKVPPPPPPAPLMETIDEDANETVSVWRRLSPLWRRRVYTALGGVALVFLLGFAFISLYSYGQERKTLENWLSQGLGVPVQIGQVTPVFSPSPMLELRQVQIGDHPERNHIDLIRLPGLFSRLFGLSFDVNDEVEISGGSLDAILLAAWKESPAPAGMARARVRQLEVHLDEHPLATLDGIVLFATNGDLRRASLRGKQLQLEVTPAGKAYSVAVTATNGWQPIPNAALELMDFVGTVLVYPDHLSLEKGDMHLLGGRYEGGLELSWQNGKVREMGGAGVLTGIRIAGLLNNIGVAKPAGATDAALELDGDLSGALRFHTSGDTPELWRKNLEAHGEMKVGRSTLRGINLMRLMRGGINGKIPRSNATTSLSQFAFNLNVNEEGLRLEKLQLRASTSLRGGGEVFVNSEGELTGRIALLLFDGEGGPGSDLLLDGRYPMLNIELRGAQEATPVSTPTNPPGRR